MEKNYKKYSRYNDSSGRLLILLNCWYKKANDVLVPTTVDILDVKAEIVYEYPESDFEKWIEKKIIKRIN